MTIKVSNNLADLTGNGEEWLVDGEGHIIATFIDGHFKQYSGKPNVDDKDTVTL